MVNQIISAIPQPGKRGIDARTTFVTKQEAFQDHLYDNTVDELNTFAGEVNNTAVAVNTTLNSSIIVRDQTTQKASEASTSATLASQKASEASSSANQALTYKNQLQGYVIPTGTSYSVEQINTQNSAMPKAEFLALSEERKANRAGSGFDEFGSNHSIYTTNNVNKGIYAPRAVDNLPNQIWLSMEDASSNKTPDGYPFTVISGVKQKLKSIGANFNKIQLPTAPNIYPYDTVLTPEQIASGVIKHADSSNSGLIVNGKFDTDTAWSKDSGWSISGGQLLGGAGTNGDSSHQAISTVIGKKYIIEYIVSSITGTLSTRVTIGNTETGSVSTKDITTAGIYTFEFTATANTHYLHFTDYCTSVAIDGVSVYPADAVSRSDLVFLESFHEDISEKNFVYPLGNVQYLGANTDGLTGIANGAFTGFEQYSLFGNWQTPSALIGKGYVWSSLTEAQKRAFISNPENNCYLDGDKTIQVRYRVRVIMGEDTNSMAKATVQGKAVVPSTVLFTVPVTTVDAGLYSNISATYTYTGTSTGAISIALVQR